MNLSRVLLALIIVTLITTSSQASPQVGDKAPEVKIAKWMTKQPPSLPGDKDADKHVFLVEFWATWCGPCWKSIPHLSELQKKYEKDGLIIIGVSNEEPETIAKFIGSEKEGKTMSMDYFVGADDEAATSKAWANDILGIPWAFLVDKSGVVMWQGNPLDPMFDSLLDKVIAGKLDLEAAKKIAANDKKFTDLMADLQTAYAMRDEAKIFSIIEELIPLKPMELQPYMIKRQMFVEFKKEDQVPAWNNKVIELFKDRPDSLSQIVQVELSKEPSQRDAALMIHCTSRLIESVKEPDAETLALFAHVQYECGMIDAAIDTQTKAVAAATKAIREDNQKALDYYKSLKQYAKDLRPVPTTTKKAS
ncbi:MAG TPA: TlpA disulfide reductase family protein [Phycisphaerae bacterium]|nr:TlpA disulfide reductase family protein [Phycisphaerae bacterium]